MNAEQPDKNRRGRDPERRASFTQPGPEAKRVIDSVLSRLTHPEDELRVLEGVLTHGAGFAAWLMLDDTAPQEPTLIHRYEQCYADAWETVDDLITDTVEALGWREELSELRKRHGIPEEYLSWNRTALLVRLREMYSLVELDGVTHAFHR